MSVQDKFAVGPVMLVQLMGLDARPRMPSARTDGAARAADTPPSSAAAGLGGHYQMPVGNIDSTYYGLKATASLDVSADPLRAHAYFEAGIDRPDTSSASDSVPAASSFPSASSDPLGALGAIHSPVPSLAAPHAPVESAVPVAVAVAVADPAAGPADPVGDPAPASPAAEPPQYLYREAGIPARTLPMDSTPIPEAMGEGPGAAAKSGVQAPADAGKDQPVFDGQSAFGDDKILDFGGANHGAVPTGADNAVTHDVDMAAADFDALLHLLFLTVGDTGTIDVADLSGGHPAEATSAAIDHTAPEMPPHSGYDGITFI